MSNKKRALRVFGLLLAAMGLTMFSAMSAQAITWDESLKEITQDLLIGGALKESALLLVAAQNLIIHCSSVDVEKDSRLLVTPNAADLFLLYLGCVTLVKGVENKSCAPTILLVKAKAVPFLHNGVIKLLVLPLEEGKPFTTIHYNEEVCALPSLPEVKGSVVFECENGLLKLVDCKEDKIVHLIRPVPQHTQELLFPTDKLLYGLNPAVIHGEAEVFLIEGGAGNPFNALV